MKTTSMDALLPQCYGLYGLLLDPLQDNISHCEFGMLFAFGTTSSMISPVIHQQIAQPPFKAEAPSIAVSSRFAGAQLCTAVASMTVDFNQIGGHLRLRNGC